MNNNFIINTRQHSYYKNCISLKFKSNKVILKTLLNYLEANFRVNKLFVDYFSHTTLINESHLKFSLNQEKRSFIRNGLIAIQKIINLPNLSWLAISNETSFSAPVVQLLIHSALSFVHQYLNRLSTKELKQILITIKALKKAYGYYLNYGFQKRLNIKKRQLS